MGKTHLRGDRARVRVWKRDAGWTLRVEGRDQRFPPRVSRTRTREGVVGHITLRPGAGTLARSEPRRPLGLKARETFRPLSGHTLLDHPSSGTMFGTRLDVATTVCDAAALEKMRPDAKGRLGRPQPGRRGNTGGPRLRRLREERPGHSRPKVG